MGVDEGVVPPSQSLYVAGVKVGGRRGAFQGSQGSVLHFRRHLLLTWVNSATFLQCRYVNIQYLAFPRSVKSCYPTIDVTFPAPT